MKQLRAIRILMAALFFAACAACLIIGPQVHPMARAASQLQIVLSSAASAAGVSLVWLGVTLIFGRVYCASVCPVGVFSDYIFGLRRRIPKLNKPFRYRTNSKYAVHILWIYLMCVVVGVSVVPFVLEPWNIARNVASIANPETIVSTWGTIGRGVAVGATVGILAIIIIALLSLWHGREFCTRFCPIGTALGYVQNYSVYHIEINPDRCTSCGKCEEICRSQCIKVVSRYVDQKRCVRCFDCVAECPEDAIRYRVNRHRPATPLMQKRTPAVNHKS